MPSISDTVGLVKQSSCQLSAYSAASDAQRILQAAAAPFHHLAHVAAGAEGPVGGRLDDDRIHLRIARPAPAKPAQSAARMAVVSALSARGRSSVTIALQHPRCRAVISAGTRSDGTSAAAGPAFASLSSTELFPAAGSSRCGRLAKRHNFVLYMSVRVSQFQVLIRTGRRRTPALTCRGISGCMSHVGGGRSFLRVGRNVCCFCAAKELAGKTGQLPPPAAKYELVWPKVEPQKAPPEPNAPPTWSTAGDRAGAAPAARFCSRAWTSSRCRRRPCAKARNAARRRR